MDGVDEAHGTGLGAQYQRIGVDAVTPETYPFEQFSLGDTGRRKEGVIGIDQIASGENLIEVESLFCGKGSLAVVARPELLLHLALESG